MLIALFIFVVILAVGYVLFQSGAFVEVLQKLAAICQSTECKSSGLSIASTHDLMILGMIVMGVLFACAFVYAVIDAYREPDRQMRELNKMHQRLVKAEQMRVMLTAEYYAQLVNSVNWLD